MNEALERLGGKMDQVIALCETLRAENRRLRDRIGALEEEKQALAGRMTAARTRLEGLMDKLPEE
jgi:cell division septum initiation protein DivIVA